MLFGSLTPIIGLTLLSVFMSLIPAGPSANFSWTAPEIGYSWGLGLVIPDGSPLRDGSTVRWNEFSNVTVVVTLPRINHTDGAIYVILSVMTSSRTILQVAAGLYPEENAWFVYSMYITATEPTEKRYVPVSIKGGPIMKPGDTASLSIYSSNSGSSVMWMEKVCNLNAGECRTASMLNDGSNVFMPGEQEIIALESYTVTESVFEHMGNMTLHSILANGIQVMGGWYVSDGMVFDRSPLFQVGGTAYVPPFISLRFTSDGKAIWYYSPSWERSTDSLSGLNVLITFMMTLLAISISLFAILPKLRKIRTSVLSFLRKVKRRYPEEHPYDGHD